MHSKIQSHFEITLNQQNLHDKGMKKTKEDTDRNMTIKTDILGAC